MSKPYDCGHPDDSDEHDDYCGVGACIVCLTRASMDGYPPHGDVMTAERTLEVHIRAPLDQLGPLFRGRVCGDCGMIEALPGMDTSLLVETFS